MTVEIKQLVIRAVAEPTRPTSEVSAQVARPEPVDRDALIEDCVREVLRQLERRRRR